MILKSFSLSERMKYYEGLTCNQTLMPLLPIILRIDGRNFHTFCQGLKKPYDVRLMDLMIETTKHLVQETNATIGYTQSDEISLILMNNRIESEIYFGGRVFKIISTLASSAGAFFNVELENYLPEKLEELPTFDCRVWQVPNIHEVVNYLRWRCNDATRNAISSASQSVYSHKELLYKNSNEQQEMLFLKGINFNNYPISFKQGSFLQRKSSTLPDSEAVRHKIEVVDLKPLKEYSNEELIQLLLKTPE